LGWARTDCIATAAAIHLAHEISLLSRLNDVPPTETTLGDAPDKCRRDSESPDAAK